MTNNRKRIKPAYRSIHRLRIDRERFVYLGYLKVARFNPERGTLEFKDHRATRKQGPSRMVEVKVQDFVKDLERMVEG